MKRLGKFITHTSVIVIGLGGLGFQHVFGQVEVEVDVNLHTYQPTNGVAGSIKSIAEDVVFMVQGELIRHRVKDYRKKLQAK